jgi:cobalt/nickel transport protein
MKKIVFFMLFLILFVPLGVLTEFPAWGEWSAEYFQKALGYVPKGIAHPVNYNAPASDYTLFGLGPVAGYYASAVLGIAVIFLIFYFVGRIQKDA